MNKALLDQIVNATLYEGYILYPYRASSKKNRRERFTFGRVYPASSRAVQDNAEPFFAQAECLVRTNGTSARVDVSARFLHPMAREIARETWHEAVEREIQAPPIDFVANHVTRTPFQFSATRETEPPSAETPTSGMAIRRQEALAGVLTVAVQSIESHLWKVTVRISNDSPAPPSDPGDAEAFLLRLFASTHLILCVTGAEFVSQIDPPADLKTIAASCQNIGVWPVLVGDEAKGERDTMLASPIILYDYPKIAPESAGALFDGTEIDEILTLRILTMTDDEKREMRGVDEQARRLLERTEALPDDSLLKMHGMMRPGSSQSEPTSAAAIEFDDFFGASTRLKGVSTGGVFLQPGDRVRLRPKARADIIDVVLNGQTAIVEAVEQDLEQRIHLAVVLENDPGKDLGFMRQPGHRFFYGLDEVEPLPEGTA